MKKLLLSIFVLIVSVSAFAGTENADIVNAAWLPTKPFSFADLAEMVQSSVVNIATSTVVKRQMLMPYQQFDQKSPFNDFFKEFMDRAPREDKLTSLGSGFLIDDAGHILTNNHVITQADEIEVHLSNGKKYKAEVIGSDKETDLAVIKIDAKEKLPFVRLGDSTAMRPGDWVMAIGNQFGLEHTVTVGVVSAKDRDVGSGPLSRFIQTDCAINPGNSGGPLFNINGEVIGVNTMIYQGPSTIGFAIPINLAKRLLPQLMTKGTVSHGWLGVVIQEITPELKKSFKMDENEEGVLISEVAKGSPAEKSGLKQGDIIMEFDGEKVKNARELQLIVSQTPIDKGVPVNILRKGEKVTIEIKVGKKNEEQVTKSESGAIQKSKTDKIGLVIGNIGIEQRNLLNLPEGISGVVVNRVEPDSSAEYAGVRADDIITEVNGTNIKSVDDYNKSTSALKSGDVVRFLIKRGNMSIYTAFKLK